MFLSILAFLSLVLPLLVLAGRTLFAERSTRIRMIALFCIVSAFSIVALRPHEDIYTGLDNSAYRLMAEAFADGRPLIGTDETLLSAPKELRPLFQYRQPGGGLRPTRDMIFQYDIKTGEDRPFFMPFLPLAAAALRKVEYFPLLLGFFWLLLLFSAAYRQNGKHGLGMAAAILVATPWFFWFTRGFFPDAAGALIASAVLLHALAQRRGNILSAVCSGLLLGLSVTIHPTSVLLTAPIFIFCVVRDRRPHIILSTTLASLAGLVPFWAITRYVCHPYGDWTRFASLVAMFKAAPEHRVLITGAVLMAVLALGSIVFACTRNGNAFLHRLLDRIPSYTWLAASLVPLILLCVLPTPFTEIIRHETVVVWTGIRVSGLLLWSLASVLILTTNKSKAVSVLFVLTCWLFIPFLMIKGAEVPVGIWSLRRAAPPAILLTALLAPLCPFPSFPGWNSHRRKILIAVGIGVLAFLNLFRWPNAYFGVNGRNAAVLRATTRAAVSACDLVVFDYHPRFVPVSPSHEIRTLGIGSFALGLWPEIEKWLSGVSATSKVAVVSSYAPVRLEEDFAFEPAQMTGGTIRNIVSKNFLPVSTDNRQIVNNILRAVPLDKATERLIQEKKLDGGPIGLRGEWYTPRNKDFAWSRQKSGIVGPVHDDEITVEIEAEWPEKQVPAPAQQMLLTPPWTTEGIPFTVEHGKTNIVLRLKKGPAFTAKATGIYTFTSPTPYNPADYGIKGYPDDLGIIIRSIRIK